MGNKGFSLVFVILLVSLLLILGNITVQTVQNINGSAISQKDGLSAFYLAEAAVEYGKSQTMKNPEWYTDLAFKNDPTTWLKSGAKGIMVKGLSKAVKIYKKDTIYGVGFSGKACVIIKFENGKFQEI